MTDEKIKYKTFEELPVWKISHWLVLEIYRHTNRFPRAEDYCLTSQMRRAVISIAANIAEGFFRKSTKELVQFLYTAKASCAEVIYYLILAKDLKYFSLEDFNCLLSKSYEVSKQLTLLIKALKRKK